VGVCFVWLAFVCVWPRILCLSAPMLLGVSLVPLCNVLFTNQAVVSLCMNRKEAHCVKHIDGIHHLARKCVASGEVQFSYCRSVDNVSDCLANTLPCSLFEIRLVGLGMLRV
jgi:hypothetical protein